MTEDRPDPAGTSITRLLREWQNGSEEALNRLMPLVHRHLHRLAIAQMSRESNSPTLQPTALVNEAYLRLAGSQLNVEGRAHFYALAARVMRRILVDQARARTAAKRQVDKVPIESDTQLRLSSEQPVSVDELIALNEAISELSHRDERKADMLVLTYFGGLSAREIGQALGVSAMTVSRELRFARAWLGKQLNAGGPPRAE